MKSINLQLNLQRDEQLLSSNLPAKVLTHCTFCNIEFMQWRYEYIKREIRFSGKRYCSRDCYNKNRPFRYNDYYYCDNCLQWIPQLEAKNMKSIPRCPKPSCNNNKLRIRSPKPKFNHKRNNANKNQRISDNT